MSFLHDTIEQKYLLDMLAILTHLNSSLNIGSVQYNYNTGSISTRLAFDAEFCTVSFHIPKSANNLKNKRYLNRLTNFFSQSLFG